MKIGDLTIFCNSYRDRHQSYLGADSLKNTYKYSIGGGEAR